MFRLISIIIRLILLLTNKCIMSNHNRILYYTITMVVVYIHIYLQVLNGVLLLYYSSFLGHVININIKWS